MRWYQFLSRLSLVCNVFFLLGVSLQLTKWFRNQDAEAMVLIIGFFMAALLNPIVNVCGGVLWLRNRSSLRTVPLWLRTANFVFLILQIVYVFYLNVH